VKDTTVSRFWSKLDTKWKKTSLLISISVATFAALSTAAWARFKIQAQDEAITQNEIQLRELKTTLKENNNALRADVKELSNKIATVSEDTKELKGSMDTVIQILTKKTRVADTRTNVYGPTLITSKVEPSNTE
jgi:uncharacterized protein YlxW (UPF0749 family)